MAPRRKTEKFKQRPFAGLNRLLSDRAVELNESRDWIRQARTPSAPLSPADEERLFQQAMADVRPLQANRQAPPPKNPASFADAKAPSTGTSVEDAEGLRQLHELVQSGKGFSLAFTAEYMAGPDGRGADHLSQRLHRGRFAMQDHIDLHGMGVGEAEVALERFFKRAIAGGKRGVIIVHGRGLRSAGPPVLKQHVRSWLTRGPWRRWVAAFASAQAYDGGTGATYVLLRQSAGRKRRG